MNVYAISDMHGELPPPPDDAELLLLAGDICPDFGAHGRMRDIDKTGTRQRDWLITDFYRWCRDHGLPIIMTWGNHDFIGEKPWLVRDMEMALGAQVSLLVDEEAVYGGLRVWGTPWVPGLPYWAFYGRQEALQARAALIPAPLDVLMTHGPPYGYGDYIPTSEKQRNKYGNFGGEYVGDTTLSLAIKEVRPKVTICGHIHEARGTYDLDGSPVYNVAAVDEVYRPVPNPYVRLFEF